MKVSGNALCFGDDVNTDVIYPGRYLPIVDRAEQALHVMEGFGDDWPQRVARYSVVVAGWNLGCGSSREQAATALIGAGVKLVIARTFSRLFFRNCINNGLPVIESEAVASAIATDALVLADLASGVADIGGRIVRFEPLPPNLIEIVRAGGLLAQLRRSRQ
jgi:3-isopropylmalate dehydratase small subunit